MKKLIFILFMSLMVMSFLPTEEVQTTIDNVECKYRQCDAIAKSTKKRCKRCVSKESDYQCYQHKPKDN